MIFFPVIGTKLKLLSDWEFPLYGESRNDSIIEALGYKCHADMPHCKNPDAQFYWKRDDYAILALPADTILKVDRVYIRKGAQDFNSITFNVVSSPFSYFQGKKKLRFWAKIEDINGKMDAEVLP